MTRHSTGNATQHSLLTCMEKESKKEDLDCKKTQPVHSEGDQPWDKAEAPVLWPPHVKS